MSSINPTTFSYQDESFMRRALELAHQGCYTTSPNPRVGCVIVHSQRSSESEPKIIGEGFHRRKGEPHAEPNAINSCTKNPEGSTLYVTLEPCCHHGVTPPCTEAIIQAGISRVVIAHTDPFKEVQGKGIKRLREKGIQVDVGLLQNDAWFENRFFFHYHQAKLPWVILKVASSLDGKLATHTGHSKWITAETSRAFVHELRGECDAILVGLGTVLSDDPTLNARINPIPEYGINQPIRIVLDPNLQTPSDAKIINTQDISPTWIFCHEGISIGEIERIESESVEVIPVQGTSEALSLRDVLNVLYTKGILSLMIEGGPTIHSAFLNENLVNEVFITIAPILVGGKDAPSFFMGEGVESINLATRLTHVQRHCLGDDTLIRGIISSAIQ